MEETKESEWDLIPTAPHDVGEFCLEFEDFFACEVLYVVCLEARVVVRA